MVRRNQQELNIDRQIGKVKAKMMNLAHRSNSACVKVLREYAQKVKERAAWFAPEESGALGNPDNWRVYEKEDGLNGRLTFTVRIKRGAKRHHKGRTSLISQYAAPMHDRTDYTIRGWDKEGNEINSRAKANRTPPRDQKRLSKYPNGSGNYVGRLYLTRALNQYRLITLQKLREAVAKELK
ncbi:hypothetical protein JCM19235_1246 [Vibrio maritimus]|uniref:Phage protein n=1 Tax=Vibrio maritimus TaxID=990268 RepID=A0A090S5F9_9VIBR|nr:hypothetical protein JCM19235_1246 [Vibrio maritimus]